MGFTIICAASLLHIAIFVPLTAMAMGSPSGAILHSTIDAPVVTPNLSIANCRSCPLMYSIVQCCPSESEDKVIGYNDVIE